MNSEKIVWRIYRSFLLIILLPALVFTIFTARTFRTFFLNHTVSTLTEKAMMLSARVSRFPRGDQPQTVDSLCKYLSKITDTRFTVLRLDGMVVGDSEKNPDSMENHSNRTEIIAALSGKTGIADRYSYTLEQQMLYIAVPTMHAGAVDGVVRASISIASINRELFRMYVKTGIGYFIVALIAVVISFVLSKRISGPIDAMKYGAQRFAEGDFSGKLMPSGCEEIDQLSNVLNDMAVRLRDTIDRLTKQRNRLDTVLSGMIEGVVALDNDDHIMVINDAAVGLFELPKKPEKGTWIGAVLRSPGLNDFVRAIREADIIPDREIAFSLAEKNGFAEERLLRLHGNKLKDGAGSTIGVLMVINDITRMKKLETMRSDFVANVSHELRTPLTSVKGFVETLLAGAIDDKDESRHFLQIIARQVDRLSTIVSDLLALSRIERESVTKELDLRKTSVKELVERALESCGSKALAKNISVVTTVSGALVAMLEPALMEEALINLIDNAIGYSPPESTVTVTAGMQDALVQFVVTDNGPGIAPEHHERIFERFYRVDKARSRNMGGTGLGLSIVKHVAILHNGSASVHSEPGKGSSFFIRIPFIDATTTEEQL